MNSMALVSFRAPLLPWTVSPDDELRFRRISQRVLITCAVLFIALPWLPVTPPDRSQAQELPERLAKLVLEREPLAAPVKPIEPLQAANDEAAKKAASKLAKDKEVPIPEARQPVPNKPAGEVAAARRRVAGVGLLAMKDDLAELHGAPVAVQIKQDIRQGPGVGTGVGVGVGSGTDAGVPTRALITSNATGGSGGINSAGFSSNTGGGGLAGRSTTLVEGVIGGGGGGGAGGGGARGRGDGTGSGMAGGTVKRGASGKASRSIEDIKLVFERNKGAIYAIYNRALREEPGLQGKVVLKLTIAPSGLVLECRIEASELHTPELEAKLLARIRQFDFGAKDVEQMIVTWPVDFLPS